MARQNIQEVNAGSRADIAFLLLIFFLVTTTMDQEVGILRLLPPPSDIEEPAPIPERNVYEVLVNANDQLLVEGEPSDISELRSAATSFYTNTSDDPSLPGLRLVTKEKVLGELSKIKISLNQNPNNPKLLQQKKLWERKLLTVNLIGEYNELPSNAVISLTNDRSTSYKAYLAVQNELSAAVNQLRDQLSIDSFGIPFEDLKPTVQEDRDKIIAIRTAVPQRISETVRQ